jgi:D-alanyl-D-alanine carboxypeptidase (penicillin-binding protein 5/6)
MRGTTPSTIRRSVVAALVAAAIVATPMAMPSAPAHAASARAEIPCPKPAVKPPAGRPARPQPPADDPVLRAVGGDALATGGLVVPAGAPQPPALTATSWLVADLDTGEVLGGCGPHEYGTPASPNWTRTGPSR